MIRIFNTNSKLDSLTLNENGLILINKRKEENSILFSEIKKIYIEKNKFSFLHKAGIVSVLFVLLTISTVYLPTEMVLSVSFLFIPLMVKVSNYKWYRLCLLDHNTIFYFKKFNNNNNNKYNYIKLADTVKKEIFYNKIMPPIQYSGIEENAAIIEDFAYPNLNIA